MLGIVVGSNGFSGHCLVINHGMICHYGESLSRFQTATAFLISDVLKNGSIATKQSRDAL